MLRMVITVAACLFIYNMGYAQPVSVKIYADSLIGNSNGIALQASDWKWHPGDNPAWKDKATDDSGWKITHTSFGILHALPGWKGFGWFRLWIRADSSVISKMLGLRLNHKGASEVYLDGKEIGGFGRVGLTESDMKAERATYQVIPLVIPDTLPHLLAIRYSNYGSYYPDFMGFESWLGNFQTLSAVRHKIFRLYDLLLLSLAVQITLALLHLFLFISYPKQKLNLYYSLFVVVLATAAYSKYLYPVTQNPAIQALSNLVFLCSIPLHALTSGILLYAVGYTRLPRRRIMIISLIALSLLAYNIMVYPSCECREPDPGFVYGTMLYVVVMLDGLWSVIKALRQRKPGVWLIAAGMLLYALFAMLFGNNIFGLAISFQQVMVIMGFATLIMPVFFSIYLALDFARTNRNLQTQLKQNETLSALNLAQAQEKTRLIAGQAEKLEQTVLERTAQVREQAEKLREMDTVKSRFFVNLTHEFRTPLALIVGPAEQILARAKEKAIHFQATLIRENANRLLALINQLLDLSKLEAGKMDLDRDPVDVAGIIKNILVAYEPLAGPRQVSLSHETTYPSYLVETDRHKLEMVLHNLLSNAVKFSNKGGQVKVSLQASNEAARPVMEITVTDNGIGIAAGKLPYIFDRFYQVDASDTRKQEGTGIGLALTKEVVELMEGEISVTSQPGMGTTLKVRLPVKHLTEQVSREGNLPGISWKQEAVKLVIDETPFMEGLPLLLLIEDNDQLRTFIRSVLDNKYKIIEAADGVEGWSLAKECIPDLVITDIMMHEMDGYQVSRQLKEHEPTSHIPVLMLTAKADVPGKIEGWEAGADGYIAKPFEPKELIALADNLISTRRKLAEKYKEEMSEQGKTSLPSMEQVFLDRVGRVIEEYMDDEQLSVDFLGGKIGLSRTQLHRKLKGIINQSPGEMIRSVRLQRALDLLKQNAGTVSEISYKVGFGNPANFSTSFSRHFGYPPSEVQQH